MRLHDLLKLTPAALALGLFVGCSEELATTPTADVTTTPPADATTTDQTSAAAAEGKDIVDTAVAAGKFGTLAKALEAAGLVETLKGAGPFTVFAPTDEAFAKLPAGTLDDLLKPENKEKLAGILTYHVVSGNVPAAEAIKLDGQTVKTVQSVTAPISVRDGAVYIGEAKVVQADVQASNGVIHVIDTVLLPPAS